MTVEDTLQILLEKHFLEVIKISLSFIGNRNEASIREIFNTLLELGLE